MVNPSSQEFVLADGRVAVFHGLNAVYKLPPYVPPSGPFDPRLSINDEDIANLVSWGFNAIRLGVMWEAVMPSSRNGSIDYAYLVQMANLTSRLANAGVYTLVDAHQDSFSRKLCGEGVPDFAVITNASSPLEQFPSPIPFHIDTDPATGYPNLTQCLELPFATYLTSFELNQAWGNLFGMPSIQTLFAKHWNAVASAFANVTGVLGYELINEPCALI